MINRKTISMDELALYLHIKDELEGLYITERQYARLYLRKLLNVHYVYILPKDMNTTESYDDLGVCFRGELLSKFKHKNNGGYPIPDKVVDYLLLTGNIYPAKGSQSFFVIHKRFKESCFGEKNIKQFSSSDEETKNRLLEECRANISNDLSARECAAKLYYDYLQMKKQYIE